MLESRFQSKLLKHLRERLPDAVIWKLNDGYTAGIPDVMISYRGNVNWFELKVYPNKATKIQIETLKRLWNGFLVTQHVYGFEVQHIVNTTCAIIVDDLSNFAALVAHIELIVRSE